MSVVKKNPLVAFFLTYLSYILSLLTLYMLNRFLFLGWNIHQMQGIEASHFLTAFLQGLRFDLVIIAPLCFILCLFTFWPHKPLRLTGLAIVLLIWIPLLFINFVDIELVNFTGRRFTRASLFLAREGQTTNLLQYKFLTAATFIGLVGLIALNWVFSKKLFQNQKGLSTPQKAFVLFIITIATVIGARGGFQYKPISYVDSKVVDHPYAHQLVLNSGFTFIKSWGQKSFQKERYFSEVELKKYLNLNSEIFKQSTHKYTDQLNIVLLIVESFSREYLSAQSMPFTYSLASSGVYFRQSYANGRRSIEGIASILSGIPALMEDPFLNSEFATNDFIGLGHLLKNKGYKTSFFHGAQNGSMRFDAFTKASGFDQYFGKNEYPNPADDDGYWGIFDEPFLQFQCQKMSEMQQPFASVVFTLSTHQPFKVPVHFDTNYKTVKSSELPIEKSFSYFDFALKNYFECAKKQTWFNRTVFVIVADHAGPSLDEKRSTFRQKFEIPIIFYSADKKILQGLNPNQFAQQIDLLPTFNDMLGLGFKKQNHLARSLYADGQKTIALYSDHYYELVGDTDPGPEHLKAIRQYFSEGLYDNRLYFPNTSGN